MPTRRQATVDDLFRQVTRIIGIANALMERYAHLAEEATSIQIAQLAQDGALRDWFEEAGREHDRISERLDRIELFLILQVANSKEQQARQITEEIRTEHAEVALRKELKQQMDNLAYARLKAARFGVNVPTDLINEIELYQENIVRIQEELRNFNV